MTDAERDVMRSSLIEQRLRQIEAEQMFQIKPYQPTSQEVLNEIKRMSLTTFHGGNWKKDL